MELRTKEGTENFWEWRNGNRGTLRVWEIDLKERNRVVIKVGSESIVHAKTERMVNHISVMTRMGVHVALVSSWAVSMGRRLLPESNDKALLSSIGQTFLIHAYAHEFVRHDMRVSQILAHHALLATSWAHRDKMIQTVESGWKTRKVIPIFNENDALSPYEMDALTTWADNDQNALLIAQIFGAKILYLITNTNGVYVNHMDPTTRISHIRASDLTDGYIAQLCWEKSDAGTGGMASKLRVAREAVKNGITTLICYDSDAFFPNPKLGTWITP